MEKVRTIKIMERLREERTVMSEAKAKVFSTEWGLADHEPFFGEDIFYPSYRTPYEVFHLVVSNCLIQRCDNPCVFFCV